MEQIETIMEQLSISGNSKQEKYETLLPQVQAVMDHNVDGIANMANMAAMLHETFGSGGRASTASSTANWYSDRSKDRSPVPA